jgi:hypothetical protein
MDSFEYRNGRKIAEIDRLVNANKEDVNLLKNMLN